MASLCVALIFATLPGAAAAGSAHALEAPAQAPHAAAPTHPVQLATIEVKGQAPGAHRSASIAAYGAASVHDTPAAVTVVGRRQLDDHQVQSVADLARADAALGDSYAPIGYYQDVSIRGFPLDLATGFRVNNLTVVGEQRFAMADVQGVEILQGLAGLQSGVMEPGGVVNFITKRPADVRTITLGTDSHGSRRVALDVGRWFTPRFGLRANVAWQRIHSYIQHADGRRLLTALAADWHITPRATLKLDANYHTDSQRSVSGYQLLGGSTIPAHASATRMLGFEPWQRPVGLRTTNFSARFRYALGNAWNLRLAAGRSRSRIDDNVAFAYGCFYVAACAGEHQTGAYFAPNGEYDIYEYRSPDDTRVAKQARATLTGQIESGYVRQDFSVGASAFQRTIDRRQEVYDYVGTANIADVNPPFFPTTGAQPGRSVRRLDSWQHTVFALDRIHLGAHWQIIAGGHIARLDERTWDSDGVPERTTRIQRALPQAAILWQPDAATTFYASYSEGLSLGQEAPYWASNAGDVLAPRLSRQIEAGAKVNAGDRLAFTAALYRIHEPYQFAQPNDSAAHFTFVQRGSEVHTGLELAAHGYATRNLRLDASVSFIRARAEDTGTAALEGHQVQNIPRLRATLFASYALPALPHLSVLGGWRYASPNSATPDGRIRVPAYNVFGAGLRYTTQWRGHPLTWRLWVDNIFNRFYWRDTGSSGGDSYLFPGAPRLARLSLTLGW